MSKHIQLSIADPCHENWDNMTAAEQGRFCGSCQKQVVDFTSMNDAQLVAFFRKSSNGSVCGRFYQDQLDRNVEMPKKRIPWVKYFFQFALPALLASAKASAQGNVIIKRSDTIFTPPAVPMVQGLISIPRTHVGVTEKIDIGGVVTDENNDPVPFASIMIKGGKLGVSADSAGVFILKNVLAGDDMLLQVSSVGFEMKEVLIARETDLSKGLEIHLTRRVLDQVVVVAYHGIVKGRVMMGSVSRVSSEKISIEIQPIQPPPEKPAMIKVYPNPVAAGTAINIGCERLEEGYYTFQLFNQAGQLVQHKQIWIDAEARIMNMEIPAVTTGSYFLTLTNRESGKKFTEKIIVQ
jgi:hypothetical protein